MTEEDLAYECNELRRLLWCVVNLHGGNIAIGRKLLEEFPAERAVLETITEADGAISIRALTEDANSNVRYLTR